MSAKLPIYRFTRVLCVVALAGGPLWVAPASAQPTPSPAPRSADASASADEAPAPLSEDEMEVLVARIALYPDELVALVSAASLYPLQIVEADRYLKDVKSNPDLKPKDDWDGSVVSLLNYPEIVQMMSEDLDWTQHLGSAIAYQQKDVLVAIQQLRNKAVAQGVIKSDDKIEVVNDNDNIVIRPTQEDTVYVPKYEPQMLYDPGYQPVPIAYYPDPYPQYYYPTATYFAGFVTGAVFAAAVDWDDWGVWGGPWHGDVDIDCNDCFNGRDFNGKINLNDVDWKNVDRSKIKFDKQQFAKLDKNDFRNSIKANNRNNIGNKAASIRDNRTGTIGGQNHNIKDVRKSTLQGLKNGPKAGNRQLPGQNRKSGLSSGAKRPSGSRPAAHRTSTHHPTRVTHSSSRPKMAGHADTRHARPSGLGQMHSGKATQLHSQRGHRSMGGGAHSRGTPHRAVHRSGGGRRR